MVYEYLINIYSFYDEYYKSDRYSFEVKYPGGISVSGGYGNDNEILYSTYEIALDFAINAIAVFDKELYKKIRREINLTILLD